MRFFASASSSSSMFFGMPGSKTRMPTSSSSDSGMWTVACLAAIFGTGRVSLVTQPPSTSDTAASVGASIVPERSLTLMSSPHHFADFL
jgi:hypothetical protein